MPPEPTLSCAAGLSALMLLTACSGAGEVPDTVPSAPEAEETGIEEPDLENSLVWADETGSPHFVDPDDRCGPPLLVASIPWDEPRARHYYSADWRYTVVGRDDGLQVWELDEAAGEYVEAYAIAAGEDTYSERAGTYSDPAFSPDGETLWFRVTTDDQEVWASVPYQDYTAGDAPDVTDRPVHTTEESVREPWLVFDGDGAPHIESHTEDNSVDFNDGELSAAYWHDLNDDLAQVNVGVWTDGVSGEVSVLLYREVAELGPNEFLMQGVPRRLFEDLPGSHSSEQADEAMERYGAVVIAQLDPDSETVDLEEVVPVDIDHQLPEWVRLDSDGTTIHMAVRGTPYTASLDDLGAEPEEMAPGEACFVGGHVYQDLGEGPIELDKPLRS